MLRPRALRTAPLLSAVFAALLLAPAASAGGPLKTAMFDPEGFLHTDRQAAAFDRSRASGATMVRLFLVWKNVAPTPPLTNPSDPGNPMYNWEWFDRQVRMAVARGLTPYVNVMYAPIWAEGAGGTGQGIYRPDRTPSARSRGQRRSATTARTRLRARPSSPAFAIGCPGESRIATTTSCPSSRAARWSRTRSTATS